MCVSIFETILEKLGPAAMGAAVNAISKAVTGTSCTAAPFKGVQYRLYVPALPFLEDANHCQHVIWVAATVAIPQHKSGAPA